MNQTENLTPITSEPREAGFVVALVGRTANKNVFSFPGFPLIRAGEKVTRQHIEWAQNIGCLFELTESTEPEQAL
jgi:hypothetical protein